MKAACARCLPRARAKLRRTGGAQYSALGVLSTGCQGRRGASSLTVKAALAGAGRRRRRCGPHPQPGPASTHPLKPPPPPTHTHIQDRQPVPQPGAAHPDRRGAAHHRAAGARRPPPWAPRGNSQCLPTPGTSCRWGVGWGGTASVPSSASSRPATRSPNPSNGAACHCCPPCLSRPAPPRPAQPASCRCRCHARAAPTH